METHAAALLLALAGIVWFLAAVRRRRERKGPPGPSALPLIGNLHMMGSHPHRTLHKLSQTYGPIMKVKLGLIHTVVVSSPEAAELFLKTHDLSFCGRPPTDVSEYAFYGGKGIGLCSYSSYWKNARKMVVMNLLTADGMQATAKLRGELFRRMAEELREFALLSKAADVSAAMKKAFESVTFKVIFGQMRSGRSFGVQEYVEKFLLYAGKFDPAQYIPFLRPLDPMGVRRGIKEASRKLDVSLEAMIEQYLKEANEFEEKDDARKGFLGKLLSMLGQPMDPKDSSTILDRDCVKGIMIDMFAAALDTSYTAAEWGISELIRNPRVMKKLQSEMDRVVGLDRVVEESDFAQLPYLEMVVKETMRLHPPGPLLVPHMCIEDVTVNGYFIPKNTRVLINAWAIGRDAAAWPERTEEFYPERFEAMDVDIHGRDFRLLPFGSGRRGCPGSRMGVNAVTLALAVLSQCFHWCLPDGVESTDLDMAEKFSLAMPREHHLIAIPTYRLRDSK